MSRSLWGVTPRQSIEAACDRLGRDAVVQACLDLLAGRDVGPELVRVLGGPRAARFLDQPVQAYWLRVWALRGLLWSWDERASSAVVGALRDDAWRVREMAARVCARNLVAEGLDALVLVRVEDPVERVRVAAGRAVVRLTAAGA